MSDHRPLCHHFFLKQSSGNFASQWLLSGIPSLLFEMTDSPVQDCANAFPDFHKSLRKSLALMFS